MEPGLKDTDESYTNWQHCAILTGAAFSSFSTDYNDCISLHPIQSELKVVYTLYTYCEYTLYRVYLTFERIRVF